MLHFLYVCVGTGEPYLISKISGKHVDTYMYIEQTIKNDKLFYIIIRPI